MLGLLLFRAFADGQSTPAIKKISLPGGVVMDFVPIPNGEFQLGSPADELDRQGDEEPVHAVRFTQPIYMGRYEVTQEQWAAVMGENPSVFKDQPNWKDYPVDWVSWEDCRRFIDKLNTLGIGTFRMPTEAEWEYACKAGGEARYYWGDDPDYAEINQHAWIYSRAEGRSQPVGQKSPNQWGLYDMCGNVWEWCSDWKGPYPTDLQIDPPGPATGTQRIFRGGSWFNLDKTARCANRNAHVPDESYTNIGLRLVLEVD